MRKIASLILAASLMTACNDQLNFLPDNYKVYGNVVIDATSAEQALGGVYYQFVEAGYDNYDNMSTDWASYHEIIPSYYLSALAVYANGGTDAAQTASSSMISYLWDNNYRLINAANGVIEQVAALDDSNFAGNRKTEIIAEARLMRAWGHYNLLRYFARFDDPSSAYGVLIRDQFSGSTNMKKARSTVSESYKFILDDIEYAISNAPATSKNISVNRWVAKGLKARVLIQRGENQDLSNVIQITNDIITNSPYTLESSYKALLWEKGLESNEVMLGIQPYDNQVGNKEAYYYRNSASYKPTALMKSVFAGDPRADWFWTTAGLICKHVGGNKVEDAFAMRLSEMYLLKAEALVRSGGSMNDARTAMKAVMGKAGVTDFTALDAITDRTALHVEVVKEFMRALSFEDGIEWSAMSRLPLAQLTAMRSWMDNKNYTILPIPAAEFEKNPTIGDQNPGYGKN